jgi:hypothetical protein
VLDRYSNTQIREPFGFKRFLETSIMEHYVIFMMLFLQSKTRKYLTVADGDPLAPIENCEGLTRACNDERRLHVHGDTVYIAGTIFADGTTGHFRLQDAWGDLEIPLHMTSGSQIYQDAETVLKHNPHIKHIVGHS